MSQMSSVYRSPDSRLRRAPSEDADATAARSPPKNPSKARACSTEMRASTSSRPAATSCASSSSRRADARSPVMFAAIEAIASAFTSGPGRPASRCASSRPLEERPGRDRVDLQQGEEPAHEEAAGVRHRVARPHREELVQPPHAFRGRTRDPVPADVDGEIGPARDVPAQRASPEDPADVVDLDVHPSEPRDEPEPGLRRVPSTLRDVVVDAAELDGFLLARLSRPEAGELAHRLVQSIARDALDVVLQHQRLVDQR